MSSLWQTALPTAAIIVVAWAWLHSNDNDNDNNNKKRFHVDYSKPSLPLVLNLITKLPNFLRHPMIIKTGIPKPPLDGIDVNVPQDCNPYEFKELVPDRLWRVRYSFAPSQAILGALRVMFGIDLTDRATILGNVAHDPILQKCVEKHMDILEELWKKNRNCIKDREQCARNNLEAGCEETQDMLVARLKDGNGLLIYNPCRMHKPAIDFLHSKGVVQFIVSGSSAHTNQLPQASATFPSAKILCAKAAELKCRAAGLDNAEYLIYTNHEDSSSTTGYQAIRSQLQRQGIDIFHVVGDILSQTLLVIAHGHLFDSDLTSYGNGHRWLHLDQKDWDCGAHKLYWSQVFYYAALHKSVIRGYLPDYRLMGMDPAAPFAKMMLDEPTPTSCRDMAMSLRDMLRTLEFEWVDNVHSKREDSLPAAEFRASVNNGWKWLDGNPLM